MTSHAWDGPGKLDHVLRRHPDRRVVEAALAHPQDRRHVLDASARCRPPAPRPRRSGVGPRALLQQALAVLQRQAGRARRPGRWRGRWRRRAPIRRERSTIRRVSSRSASLSRVRSKNSPSSERIGPSTSSTKSEGSPHASRFATTPSIASGVARSAVSRYSSRPSGPASRRRSASWVGVGRALSRIQRAHRASAPSSQLGRGRRRAVRRIAARTRARPWPARRPRRGRPRPSGRSAARSPSASRRPRRPAGQARAASCRPRSPGCRPGPGARRSAATRRPAGSRAPRRRPRSGRAAGRRGRSAARRAGPDPGRC